MGMTKIEWTEKVWNPVTGCTKISPGCKNCYAERMSKRLRGRYGYPADDPFKVTLHPDRLEQPLHWKKPRRVFVCSMGDLFHKDVPFEFVRKVFHVILKANHHTFTILTKRPERMLRYFNAQNLKGSYWYVWTKMVKLELGISAENQDYADMRIPYLLAIPQEIKAVRFVSIEPMLSEIKLPLAMCERCNGMIYEDGLSCPNCNQPVMGIKLDWVIVGGESGPGARPMHPNWPRGVRDQCVDAGVNFFFKQWGEWAPVYPAYDELDALGEESYTGKMGITNICGSQKREILVGTNGGIFQETSYLAPRNIPFAEGFREEPYDLELNGLNKVDLKTVNPWWLAKVGKKAAGRLLDGKEWSETP